MYYLHCVVSLHILLSFDFHMNVEKFRVVVGGDVCIWIIMSATKTDLTRENTAVLHSTLSILLVNIYAVDHGLLYRY